jgi:hypothetical protein
MASTSTFCRAQEALQNERAANARLENVRIIATRAALAWGREAALAEQRETKRGFEKSLPNPGSLSEELEDRSLSENPDRGLTARRIIRFLSATFS